MCVLKKIFGHRFEHLKAFISATRNVTTSDIQIVPLQKCQVLVKDRCWIASSWFLSVLVSIVFGFLSSALHLIKILPPPTPNTVFRSFIPFVMACPSNNVDGGEIYNVIVKVVPVVAPFILNHFPVGISRLTFIGPNFENDRNLPSLHFRFFRQ